jgi:hypothetical protein
VRRKVLYEAINTQRGVLSVVLQTLLDLIIQSRRDVVLGSKSVEKQHLFLENGVSGVEVRKHRRQGSRNEGKYYHSNHHEHYAEHALNHVDA